MDRDLPVRIVQQALNRLELDASIEGDYLVARRVAKGPVAYKLWLRKGEKELLRAATVRNRYKHILDIPTDMFYAEVKKVESDSPPPA